MRQLSVTTRRTPDLTRAPIAGIGRRILAFAIDGLAIVFVYVLAFVLGAAITGSAASALASTIAVVLLIGYLLVSAATLGVAGRTFGASVLRLAVVDAKSRAPIGFTRSLLRGIVLGPGLVTWLGALLLLISAVGLDRSGQRRGWHDRIARTIVLDGRVSTG